MFAGRKKYTGSICENARKYIEYFCVDSKKINIVMNHQPKELRSLAEHGVGIFFSGHTHNGQIFPAGSICALFGINEPEYGAKKIGNMNAVVSFGVSTWAMNMCTQGDSEIVIVNTEQNQQ